MYLRCTVRSAGDRRIEFVGLIKFRPRFFNSAAPQEHSNPSFIYISLDLLISIFILTIIIIIINFQNVLSISQRKLFPFFFLNVVLIIHDERIYNSLIFFYPVTIRGSNFARLPRIPPGQVIYQIK